MIFTIGETYLFWLVFNLIVENDEITLILFNGIGVINSLIQLFEIECNCKKITNETDEMYE